MIMGSAYAKNVVDTAINEIGYQGETYSSKYSKTLDSVNWYNGRKDGACTWCAIFVDYCIYVNKGNLSDEEARQIVCEPSNHAANTGAGCTQHAQMYKDKGRWYTHTAKGCPAQVGDQVFFKKSNGAIYHTGIVVDWDNNGIYTVEGSTGGAKVLKRFYAYSDTKLAGYGRPDWYKYEDSKPDPTPEPQPEPTPEPTPTPAPSDTYRVCVNTSLNVRLGPGTSYPVVGALSNGTIVTVYETSNGWGRISTDSRWVSMNYLTAVSNSGTPYTVSVNSVLNVRKGPGTNYPIVDQLKNDTKVYVSETSNGWGKIGTDRWVSMNYLK